MFVLAHIGHWYTEILYGGPVVVIVVWLKIGDLREKRLARRKPTPPEPLGRPVDEG